MKPPHAKLVHVSCSCFFPPRPGPFLSPSNLHPLPAPSFREEIFSLQGMNLTVIADLNKDVGDNFHENSGGP